MLRREKEKELVRIRGNGHNRRRRRVPRGNLPESPLPAIPRVAVIVPALNEAARIGSVLDALTRVSQIDEIIVVSDGSTDDTADVARRFPGVKVIELPENLGKGGAMFEGVRHTEADILTFLDADLIGLKSEQVSALIEPVLARGIDMSIGIFRRGRYLTDLSQRLVPYVSGQRALRRTVFLTVPEVKSARMGVEIALTTHAKVNRYRVARIYLDGVTHPTKEEKLGFVRGFGGRMNMYWEIVRYVAQQRLRHRKRTVLRWLHRNGRKPGSADSGH
jgi:glycosyltransferase involved in cell wall biosynthesis